MNTINQSLQSLHKAPVFVIGAGIMGAGIAQIAAQAGHHVLLFDTQDQAAVRAVQKLSVTFDKLVEKGKISATDAQAALKRIEPARSIDDAKGVALVIEAIVEKLDIKRSVMASLEAVVSPQCILASNTSSISVTAIANGLKHPERLVGMHFFNPVPVMKLVEIVSGLQTNVTVADTLFALSKDWGKTPVHAKSTPGFIVNRIARPYYAESLAIALEQGASYAVIDACLRAAGFKMGPFELMDLIGHDTNFSVTSSVYAANYYDKRFVPSLIQSALVDGGMLGRKTGQGFYDYRDGASTTAQVAKFEACAIPAHQHLVLHGVGPVAEQLGQRLQKMACPFERNTQRDWVGLEIDGHVLRQTDGRCATALCQSTQKVAVYDLALSPVDGSALAWAPHLNASTEFTSTMQQWLRALGFNTMQIEDVPGLVVARTLAMLINEAADAVQQGVCSIEAADLAMKLGVNYPAGPFEWLDQWGVPAVTQVLDNLNDFYRGERYRVSPWLRLRSFKSSI